MEAQILKPCQSWASSMNTSMNSGMGFTAAGEWSNAINDCGLNVNGVGLGTRYEGTFTGFAGKGTGDCSVWTDYKNWSNATREGIKQFNLASMDALQVCPPVVVRDGPV
jgi:glucan 1,3-beta-glucosidase